MSKAIRQAVSVILRCEGKIFYIKRQNFLRAFPGYTAFPGGKRDQNDLELVDTLRREVKEELDFNIPHTVKISKLAKATSPEFNPVRFETYFYLVDLDYIPKLNVDTNEAAEYGWVGPQNIVDDYLAGKRLIVPPVRKVFEKLCTGDDSYIDFDRSRFSDELIPWIQSINGLKQIMPLSNTVPPATRTNAFLFGDTLVDPSPRDEEEYSKLKKTITEDKVKKILITHHHGDHHQFANDLARELNIPIFISEDSYNRILKKRSDYFNDIEISYLKDEMIVGSWLGNEVKVYSIPGHDEGHFALAPIGLEWMIVGDLFQGVGTVVVGGPEGDMQKYMQSLTKVINMKPACVIPSHGIALGGTTILEKTYKHRELREEQVLDLLTQKKSIDEILDIIYFNIPTAVLKYARANIESHIIKLTKDGKIK